MFLHSYTFNRKIGQGSYGEVWLVEDKSHKKCVLKKISLLNASERDKDSARLECQLLKQMIHPNIVQYRDSFEDNGILYIAMAYCEGGDLYTVLKERKGKPLSEKQITEWFIQIVMALNYIHEKNILHRDLKTQNIFLGKSSVIKVGDLGIAKQLDTKNSMAMTMIGTPYYMSPELFNKRPYNFKSDIWSLGCITYEMATLKHAFNAKDYNALSYKIIMGHMPSMPSTYSKDLVNLIESMLCNKPEKRPSTNKILREPYIQQHIQNFLDNARRCKRPSSVSQAQPRTHGNRSESLDSVHRTGGSLPINSPQIAAHDKLITSNKALPRQSHHSPVKLDRNENDNIELCHPARHRNSLDNKDERKSSQTALEKEYAKIDINEKPKPAITNILKSVSSSDIAKKENKQEKEPENDVKKPDMSSARNRRRERNREQGLKTMIFSCPDDQHFNEQEEPQDKSNNDAKSNKRPARGRRRNSDNEEVLVLPELKKRPDVVYMSDETERADLIDLVEKMNETLSFSRPRKFKDVTDSLLIPVNCYDDTCEGPQEDCAQTLRRTKLIDSRYPEIRKEIIKSIGYKKLAEGYEILKDMELDHELHLKCLLGEEDYHRYAGKITWLKMIEEPF